MFRNTIYLLLFYLVLSSCSRPLADFACELHDDQVPTQADFENKSQNAETYQWDFGDGNTSKEESPSHRYTESGNYEVELKVTGKKGKTNTYKSRMMVKAPKSCMVEIQTNFGNMIVELYDETPKHRDNFFKLAESGFYDELLFHRIIDGFMIQGGDPHSRDAQPGSMLGSGGPGYKIPAEFYEDYVHIKGALAAARQGDQVNPERASSGSQFYIVHGKPMSEQDIQLIEKRTGIQYSEEQKKAYMERGGTPFLDGQYTVFGQVVSGLEVIDKIATVQTARGDRPLEDVKMKVVTIK